MSLTNDLVGHWTFDDGDATASVGVDGTNSGGSFESANSRTVASFASADYIQVDDGGADFTTEDFSAAFWFYNEGASGDWAAIMGNQYGDESGNGWGWSVQRYYGNDTLFSVNTGNGGPNWSNNHSSQFTIPLNTWTHVVMTRVGTEMKIYLNGADSGFTGTSHASIGHQSDFLKIGDSITGKYDDVRLYSRALSAGDVASLYAETTVFDLTDGLVAKYALDTDGSDSVGSNNGTNANVTFADGAAQFNGSDARFTLASEPFTASDADYTISVWAMHNNLSSTQRLLGWGDTNGRYFVGYHTGRDHIYIGMGDIDIDPTVAYKPVAGQVEHWVFSNSGNTTKFYKDGVLIDTVVHGATGAISAGVGMRIGSVYMEFGEYLDGSMDDLRVWNRQLSDAEVTALYAAGAEPFAPPTLSDLLVLRHHAEDTSADVGDAAVTLVNVASEEVDGKSVWSFSGQDSIVRLDEVSDQPDLTGDFSISMWFKGLVSTGTWRTAARCYTSDHPILVSFDTDLLGVYDNDTDAFVSSGYMMDSANFTDWNHITAVGSGNSTKFYINGSLVGEAPAKASGALYAIGNHAWSGDPTIGTQQFADYIDDICVFSAALTDAQVLEHYNAGADTEAIPETVGVTIDMFDSYGDSWNGGSISISDSNGVVVYSSTGPANGVKAPAGLSESGSFEPGTYTYTMTPGSYPGEITCTITDEYGTVLANLVGNSGTGTFDLAAPSPVITPTLTTSNGDITIAATLNAEATAAGAIGWAYSLSPLGAEGQPHGGTLLALGLDATVTPGTYAVHTVYVAAVDASGNVIVSNSDTIDNSPTISVTIVKADSYNDSWDGTSLVITHDGTGDELYNATLASGASPLTVLVDLPYGTYSWALVGGNYHNEHTVTITLTSDGSQLAHSAGHSPSSGSFTVGPPAAAIEASVSVSGADITVTGTANATAVSDGAANWSASLTEYGAVGAVIDGAKALTALGADAVITAPGGGMHTVYVAVVDASGLIIAKSSVDASVFISQLEVGDQMILMTYLSHPSLSPAGTHAQLTNDDGDLKWGPFYVGDLTIKSITPVSSDESEILQSITFDDGSGGTLNLNELTKELIKKYDLNMLFGDNSNDGLFFQSVIDGTAPIDGAAQLLTWDGSDSLTVMLEAGGGGWAASYDTLVDPYGNQVSEFPPGSEDAYGPDGSSFVGTIAPGEVAPAQVVGAPAKIRIKFGGAIYTSSVVIKDGNGDWLAAFAGEAMAYGNNYYHADALAARDDGKMIQAGDSNAYNSDGNGTPKGSAIGIMTALDGGNSYDVAGYTFEYDMALPEGDYTIHAYAGYDQGALPTSVYILDADDNLVAQVVSDGSGFDNTYYPVTIGTPAPAAYEWTHGGQLVSIKHFEIGESIGGASAYGYTKEEPGEGTTTMYFASDFQTWSTFTQYTALQSGIEGAPMCLTHGAANLWLLGTDGGKVYEIALLDADASTATFTEVWSSPTEEPINAVKFDVGTSRWIFESGDALYTMDQGGANAQSQVSLLAGEKVVDIQTGEGYIVYVVRKADYSFELLVSDSAWGNVKDSSQMQPVLASHAAIDVNYDPIADLWTASSADGQVIMTDDLSNWLL